MKKSKFTEERILFSLNQADAGQPVTDVCRQMGISQATYEKRAEVTFRKNSNPLQHSGLAQAELAIDFEIRLAVGLIAW